MRRQAARAGQERLVRLQRVSRPLARSHGVPGQMTSQTRPEGGSSPRRTWSFEPRGLATRRGLNGSYVEGCCQPRTWLFELSGRAARQGLKSQVRDSPHHPALLSSPPISPAWRIVTFDLTPERPPIPFRVFAGARRAETKGGPMDRRRFLKTGAVTLAAAGLVRPLTAMAAEPSSEAKWRTFEVRSRVDIINPSGVSRAWVPMPLAPDTDYQKSLAQSWTGNAAVMRVYRDDRYGSAIFYAEWPAGESAPAVEATKGATTDLAKGKAIYEWIVENTFRDPKTRGCGLGDIKALLETGNLGGKCADLNALFVGMARSVGLPARDIYGVRVADSAEYKSLGKSGDITKAQHCRAEF